MLSVNDTTGAPDEMQAYLAAKAIRELQQRQGLAGLAAPEAPAPEQPGIAALTAPTELRNDIPPPPPPFPQGVAALAEQKPAKDPWAYDVPEARTGIASLLDLVTDPFTGNKEKRSFNGALEAARQMGRQRQAAPAKEGGYQYHDDVRQGGKTYAGWFDKMGNVKPGTQLEEVPADVKSENGGYIYRDNVRQGGKRYGGWFDKLGNLKPDTKLEEVPADDGPPIDPNQLATAANSFFEKYNSSTADDRGKLNYYGYAEDAYQTLMKDPNDLQAWDQLVFSVARAVSPEAVTESDIARKSQPGGAYDKIKTLLGLEVGKGVNMDVARRLMRSGRSIGRGARDRIMQRRKATRSGVEVTPGLQNYMTYILGEDPREVQSDSKWQPGDGE